MAETERKFFHGIISGERQKVTEASTPFQDEDENYFIGTMEFKWQKQ